MQENKFIVIKDGTLKNSSYVENKKSGEPVALLTYYRRWRKHVFESYEGTVWTDECLELVIGFLKSLKMNIGRGGKK